MGIGFRIHVLFHIQFTFEMVVIWYILHLLCFLITGHFLPMFIKGKPNLLITVVRTCYCVRYRWLSGVGVAVPVDAYTFL